MIRVEYDLFAITNGEGEYEEDGYRIVFPENLPAVPRVGEFIICCDNPYIGAVPHKILKVAYTPNDSVVLSLDKPDE